jgi:hypothetical protein
MDTPDTPVEVKKRGRNPKKEYSTPIGEFRAEEAKRFREKRENDPIVEKFYMLVGKKLLFCKRKKTGTVMKVFVGSLDDPKHGPKLTKMAQELKAEGRLVTRI